MSTDQNLVIFRDKMSIQNILEIKYHFFFFNSHKKKRIGIQISNFYFSSQPIELPLKN